MVARTPVMDRRGPKSPATSALEDILDPELDDARGAVLRGNATERTGVEVRDEPAGGFLGAGVAPVERVEQVERLEAQLDPLRGDDGNFARDGQVYVPVVWSREGIPDQVAVCPWFRLPKGVGIEPARQRFPVHIIRNLVHPLIPLSRERV